MVTLAGLLHGEDRTRRTRQDRLLGEVAIEQGGD
jgi:hypothetical protein